MKILKLDGYNGYVRLGDDSIHGAVVENLLDGEYIGSYNKYDPQKNQVIHKIQVMKIKFISPFETMGSVNTDRNWVPDYNTIHKSGADRDGYIARGFFNIDGSMLINAATPDGYLVGADGKMVKQ